jgi:hypothetical protein
MSERQKSDQAMNTWLVIHAASTWCLVGLIWLIQVVHYPLLKNVGHASFVTYHERHMALITWVVGPLMLAEVGSAGWLLLLGERSWLFGISLGALALIWISTVFVQIPLHQKLTRGYDAAVIDQLVSTNGWRTLAWTARGLCLAVLLIQKLR